MWGVGVEVVRVVEGGVLHGGSKHDHGERPGPGVVLYREGSCTWPILPWYLAGWGSPAGYPPRQYFEPTSGTQTVKQ